MKKIISIIIVIAVLLVVAGAVYYFSYQMGYQNGVADCKANAGNVVSNPLEKMPDTNPFDKIVNPFKDAYKNPFK